MCRKTGGGNIKPENVFLITLVTFTPSGVFHHLMMLERTEAAGLQRHQQERVEDLRATAATLRAKRARIQAEIAAIKVCRELLYKRFQLSIYLCF